MLKFLLCYTVRFKVENAILKEKNQGKIPTDTKVFISVDDDVNNIRTACNISNDTAWLIKFLKIKNTSKTKLDRKNNIVIT